MKVRRGRDSDLAGMTRLEAESFEEARRDSVWMTRHSLASAHQEVWIVEGESGDVAGSMILRFFRNTCRIHSIAVARSLRGQGLGQRLLRQAQRRAKARGCRRIHLEADARNLALLAWYEQNGYTRLARLPHYYGRRWHGWRFRKEL